MSRYKTPTHEQIATGVSAACECDGRGCWLCMAADTIRDQQTALATAIAKRDEAWADKRQAALTHEKELAEAQYEAKAMRHERDVEIHARIEAERAAEESEIAFKAAHAEMDEAEAALAEARRVLRKVQWVSGVFVHVCPLCFGRNERHYDDCALAVVLAQEEQP